MKDVIARRPLGPTWVVSTFTSFAMTIYYVLLIRACFEFCLPAGRRYAGILKLGIRQVFDLYLLPETFQHLLHILFPPRSNHQFHDCFVRIFGPHDSHPFIRFDDEFEIGNILSMEPKVFRLSIHLPDRKSSE